MSWRRLLWIIAAVLLLLAALVAYSPNPRLSRHSTPLALAGFGVFFLGWAATGAVLD